VKVPTFHVVPLHGAVVGTSPFRRGGVQWATVIAKAAFELPVTGSARRVDATALASGGALVTRDAYYHELRASSLRAAREDMPYLPNAGVVLRGHALAHLDRPVPEMLVRLALERDGFLFDKSVRILGDRAPASSAPPKAFTKMPLVYERAFGGPRRKDNPVGIGHERMSSALPNLVDPGDAERPAGFGPVSPYWSERRNHLCGIDVAAALVDGPDLPESFGGAFFQPAPADQQTDFLTGGECLRLEGVHPERAKIEARLPELTASARTSQDGKVRPVEMFADLLVLDTDELSFVIVWRGTFEVTTAKPVLVAAAIAEPGSTVEWPAELALAEPSVAPLSVVPPPPEAAEADEADSSVRAELARRLREGESLEEMDLTGSDLSGFDFDGANLSSVDLSDANLRGCRMVGVVLQGARLCRADLSSADLTGSDLTDADLLRAKLIDAKFDGANLATAKLSEAVGIGASFDGAKLGKATLARGTWRGASFKGAEMEQVDLSGAELSGATFQKASMVQARLADAKASEAVFDSACLDRARAERAELTKSSFLEIQADASVWEGATLTDSTFEGAVLGGTNFIQSSLGGADFRNAKMHGARLRQAKAPKAGFQDADLSAAKLQRLVGPDSDFEAAQLEGADLGQAELTGASFSGAKMMKVWLDRADLSRATLRHADLSKASLRSTNLHAADLTRTKLDGADLRDAELSEACLDQASTAGAKMSGAKRTE